jgi:hypothetical protein
MAHAGRGRVLSLRPPSQPNRGVPMAAPIDRRLHIGNLLHQRVVQSHVIAMMGDAFAEAERSVPARPPNLFFDTSNIVLMAQLFHGTTLTDKETVCEVYPDLVAKLADHGINLDDDTLDAEEEAHFMSRVGAAVCTTESDVGFAGLDAAQLADALGADNKDEDDEEEEEDEIKTPPPTKTTQRRGAGKTPRAKRSAKRKKGAAPSVRSSMSLGEILGHPILMHDNPEVQRAIKLNYNAPEVHYAAIRAQCQWVNMYNNNHLVRIPPSLIHTCRE